jgi:hypothetical protein
MKSKAAVVKNELTIRVAVLQKSFRGQSLPKKNYENSLNIFGLLANRPTIARARARWPDFWQ